MLESKLLNRLIQQRLANLYRIRKPLTNSISNQIHYQDKKYISFSSNDYLGLAMHPDVISALQKGAARYGVGSGASQLVTGYRDIHQQVEQAFAEFLQRDRALLFSNGYLANLSVMQMLLNQQAIVYQDKRNHASLLDGALLSGTRLKRFKHGDTDSLQKLLAAQTQGEKLIATDSVFSMDGDIAPVNKLAQLAQRHSAWLMVDDAHGFGVLGLQGRGTLEYLGLSQTEVAILVCPLAKALGVMGAIVAGSEILIESLVQFSRPYSYTTALPPALASALKASLTILETETWRRHKLHDNINYFKQGAAVRKIKLQPSITAIQSLIIGDAKTAQQFSTALLEKGFFISAMRPPTVPKNYASMRISLTSLHTQTQLDKLLDCLSKLLKKFFPNEQ